MKHDDDRLVKRAPSLPLNYRRCLKDIIAGYYAPRTLSSRNARIIASLCDPVVLGRLNGAELGNVLGWMGRLTDRKLAWEFQRKVLSRPEELFYSFDALVCFVAAPIFCPSLLVHGKSGWLLVPRNKFGKCHPAFAIANFALKALRGFEAVFKKTSSDSSLSEWGETRDHLLRKYPESLVSLVRADCVEGLRLMTDIRMEPMPIALMLCEGGPECHRLLSRPETYEGCEADLESLAAFAAMVLGGDMAMSILQALESETPGSLRTIKDDAGHNLLWYLAFRHEISMESFSRRRTSSPSGEATIANLRDFLLKEANCDPEERDVFDLSWADVRGRLGV